MKCLLILLSPIPIAIWTVVGVVGSVIMAIYYAFIWPVMETFKPVSEEGLSVPRKLFRCLTVQLLFLEFIDDIHINLCLLIWGLYAELLIDEYVYVRMELGVMYGERARLCVILQISRSILISR